MLKTPLGIITTLINGAQTNYRIEKLRTTEKRFSVDARYKLTVDIPPTITGNVVECKLVCAHGLDIRGHVESGEDLAMLSFYRDKIKLSIGAEDSQNILCEYLDYGIKATFNSPAPANIDFGVAWVLMKNKDTEDIYTWLAADPALF